MSFYREKAARSTFKALSHGRTVQMRNLNFVIPLFSKSSLWTMPWFHLGMERFPPKTCCLLASLKAGRGIIYSKQTSLGHFKSPSLFVKLLLNGAVPIRGWISFSLQLAIMTLLPLELKKTKPVQGSCRSTLEIEEVRSWRERQRTQRLTYEISTPQ